MINRAFFIKELELKYYVGINQIKFDFHQFLQSNKLKNEKEALDYIFNILEELNDHHKESTIQFIKDKYVLNQDHIFIASYYMVKAFLDNLNISNKRNIEFLLYLSTHRQISRGIESFGIDYSELKEGTLTTCIISTNNHLNDINDQILNLLMAIEIEITINNLTTEKINKIIDYFEFSKAQIKSVLNSYGKSDISDLENNLDSLSLAVFDLICERMALLNLEKI